MHTFIMIMAFSVLGFLILELGLGFWISKRDALGSVVEEKLCKEPHDWKVASFVDPADYLKFKKNPEAFGNELPAQHFCIKCGYLPSAELMLRPKYLAKAREATQTTELKKQLQKKYDELQVAFLEEYFEKHPLTDAEKELVKTGFKLHDDLIGVLPDLIQAKTTYMQE